MIILSLITLGLVLFLKMLPLEYFLVLLILLLLITLGLVSLIFSKNYKSIVGGLFGLGYVVLLIMFIIYRFNKLKMLYILRVIQAI